jgi:hypothetical protein
MCPRSLGPSRARRPNADRLADLDDPHLGEQRERHGSYRWVAVIAAGRRVRCW